MKHNFSAGPSILPQPVFKEASQAVVDFEGIGLSILEISHRSPEFTLVLNETQALVRDHFNVGEEWHVLFLTGGASTQFFMSVMNVLGKDMKAYYINTGSWSKKAIKEARRLGNIQVIASSEEENFTYIPKDYSIPDDGRFLHITSNNTIFGTQYQTLPETDIPIVADMSSDILSKPIDTDRFGLIYAGAQKNLGPAGVTLVLVKKDFLEQYQPDIPTMLDYRTHIAKGSAFNTPPVFPIYVMMLNLRWLRDQGGAVAMAKKNAEKAELLYGEIDSNPLFEGVVATEDRSHMNATFTLKESSLEGEFLQMCKAADIVGVKGHRSVGGFRASMYNAMHIDSVKALVDVMREFSAKHG